MKSCLDSQVSCACEQRNGRARRPLELCDWLCGRMVIPSVMCFVLVEGAVRSRQVQSVQRLATRLLSAGSRPSLLPNHPLCGLDSRRGMSNRAPKKSQSQRYKPWRSGQQGRRACERSAGWTTCGTGPALGGWSQGPSQKSRRDLLAICEVCLAVVGAAHRRLCHRGRTDGRT
jgi:hypothetical protein